LSDVRAGRHLCGANTVCEHSDFDVSQPWGDRAFRGAGFGGAKMLNQLAAVVAGPNVG
jgi:hypothetical protein